MIKAIRNKKTWAGSHRQDFHNEWNARLIFSLTDLKLALGDDVMDELEEIDHIQAIMLQRGTGKLRKCKTCGDVYVNNISNEIRFGSWLNKNGYVCYFCRTKTEKPMDEKSVKKREIMQKVWELYLKRLNQGVKIIKIWNIENKNYGK